MKYSNYYLKTLKEVPKEAVIASHQLMLRAGMIKKLASGVYTLLPLGLKVMQKAENIVREEMDKAGALELSMPIFQPAELWYESNRYDLMGSAMLRLTDRHNREFVLGPTHEEVITDIVRNDISSYKDLPFNLYQIQTKFRDEQRPRYGLMRTREFLMKDAYSFHADLDSLKMEFVNMRNAYTNIFKRMGANFQNVIADAGQIGGSNSASEEFHVLANAGEDEIIYCDSCGYASNLERAESIITKAVVNKGGEIKLVDTPNVTKISDVVHDLNVDITNTVKAIMYSNLERSKHYMVLMRGDYDVNEVKLLHATNEIELQLTNDEDLISLGLIKGFIGPYNLDKRANLVIIADRSIVDLQNHTAGGNQVDTHYINVSFADYEVDVVSDVRATKALDSCINCSGQLATKRGIEVGHIFMLHDKYSKSLNALYLDQNGVEKPILMGCYGIGIGRSVAAVIEQNHDEHGIIWPLSLTPFTVEVMFANQKNALQVTVANELYNELSNDFDVLFDDRNERLGFKLKDGDLIGIPFKVIVGRGVEEQIVEVKNRYNNETVEVAISDVKAMLKHLINEFTISQ